jgi:hypothetical protein
MGLTSVVAAPHSGPEIGVIAIFDLASAERIAYRDVAAPARAVALDTAENHVLVACQRALPESGSRDEIPDPSTVPGTLLTLSRDTLEVIATSPSAPFPTTILRGADGIFVAGTDDLDDTTFGIWRHANSAASGEKLPVKLVGDPVLLSQDTELVTPTVAGLVVLSTESGEELRSRPLAGVIGLATGGSRLFVSTREQSEATGQPGGTIYELNPSTLATVRRYDIAGHGPDALWVDSAERVLAVSQVTAEVVATVIVLATDEHVVVDGEHEWADMILTGTTPDGQMLLVAAGDWGERGQLTVNDKPTAAMTDRIDIPGPPEAMAYLPDGTTVFISSLDSDQIIAIELRDAPEAPTLRAGQTLQAGFGSALLVSADGTRLFAAGSRDT